MANYKRPKSIYGINVNDDEFDVSDSVPIPRIDDELDDEITQKHHTTYHIDIVRLEDLKDVDNDVDDGGLGIHEAFKVFWPDHQDHELIGQSDTASRVVLYCTDCDLELHIPAIRFRSRMR